MSALTRVLFWCLFPELRSNEGNKHQITLPWALKKFVTRVHTLFSFYDSLGVDEATMEDVCKICRFRYNNKAQQSATVCIFLWMCCKFICKKWTEKLYSLLGDTNIVDMTASRVLTCNAWLCNIISEYKQFRSCITRVLNFCIVSA